MLHPQVWVKVNTKVDKKIAGLIEALSLFPELHTIESCQGNKEDSAWISFTYGNDWKDLSEFVLGYFGPNIAREIGDIVTISLNINSFGLIQAEISIKPGGIKRTDIAIRNLAFSVGSSIFMTSGAHRNEIT